MALGMMIKCRCSMVDMYNVSQHYCNMYCPLQSPTGVTSVVASSVAMEEGGSGGGGSTDATVATVGIILGVLVAITPVLVIVIVAITIVIRKKRTLYKLKPGQRRDFSNAVYSGVLQQWCTQDIAAQPSMRSGVALTYQSFKGIPQPMFATRTYYYII